MTNVWTITRVIGAELPGVQDLILIRLPNPSSPCQIGELHAGNSTATAPQHHAYDVEVVHVKFVHVRLLHDIGPLLLSGTNYPAPQNFRQFLGACVEFTSERV